jgi:hypothetical protein
LDVESGIIPVRTTAGDGRISRRFSHREDEPSRAHVALPTRSECLSGDGVSRLLFFDDE